MRTTTALCMAVLVAFGMLAGFATPASAQIDGGVVYLYDANLNDASSNGNTGMPVDTIGNPAIPSYSTNVPFAYAGNRSLILDENTFVNVPLNASNSTQTGSWTYETWINTSATPNTEALFTFAMNAHQPSPIGQTPKWQATLTSESIYGGLVPFIALDDGPNPSLTMFGTTQLTQNNWHHLAIVVDRPLNQARLYVDGALEPLQDGGANPIGNSLDITGLGDLQDATAQLTLGSHVTYVDPLPGFMDETRLILRVLSDAEILQNANMSLIPEPSTLSLLALGGGLALLMRRRRRA